MLMKICKPVMHLSKRIMFGGGDPGHPQDYNRGPSYHTADSDNSNSFRHHSDILALQVILMEI